MAWLRFPAGQNNIITLHSQYLLISINTSLHSCSYPASKPIKYTSQVYAEKHKQDLGLITKEVLLLFPEDKVII